MVGALNVHPSPVMRSAPVRKCARASCLGFPSLIPRSMDHTAACSSRLTRLSGTWHKERQEGGWLDGTNFLKVYKIPFAANFGNKMDME